MRHLSVSMAPLILAFCSCVSTPAQPGDPFKLVPPPRPAPVEPAPKATSEFLMLQPEYKPEYGDDTDKTRIAQQGWDVIRASARRENPLPLVADLPEMNLRVPKSAANCTFKQVSFTQETEVKDASLSVDPALAERGAEIVAQHREGKEEFRGTWRPPNVGGFWPQSEYLADGGENGRKIYVEEDWTVRNLGVEDTIAHFDTLDGRTVVQPSNRIHLYAPRFASVRKIEGVVDSGQITALSAANNQLALNVDRGNEQLGYAAQESKAGYARTRNQLGGVAGRHVGAGAGTTQGPGSFGNFESAMLYSNWLRQNSIGSAELAYLAEGSAGARAWQGVEGVKVRMNLLAPMVASSEEGAESFFQIEEDDSKTSKLRLIKVASKKSAQPGDIVEFTLRFDNVGNQPIGNVTVIDNLTTRLEFLPGTAQSSVKSGFVVEPNEASSFTLRFEITDPLLPGQFGVVQFSCRVR